MENSELKKYCILSSWNQDKNEIRKYDPNHFRYIWSANGNFLKKLHKIGYRMRPELINSTQQFKKKESEQRLQLCIKGDFSIKDSEK